jgi:anti-sigma factor RsiW
VNEHAELADLLAGYVDEELTAEQRQRVERHLSECASCRGELRAQTVIRARLMKESPSSASAELAARVIGRIETVPPVAERPGAPRRQRVLAWSGWAAAAAMGGVALWLGLRSPAPMNMTMGPQTPVALDHAPSEVATTVLDSFRQLNEEELPTGVDLAKLRRELNFSVPALEAPHMRLISAWSTTINGEPAAALAYRCHDRLVVQFVVSEKQFFRQPQFRRAIASQGVYASALGPLTTIAWPGTDNGSFLVGEFSASDLVAMRS